MVILKYEIRNHAKYIFVWAIALAVCIFLMIPVYYSLLNGAESSANPLYETLGSSNFFQSVGVSVEYLTAPLGTYSFLTSFFMLASGIFVMHFGMSIHTKGFSEKTSEYLFTKPVNRNQIVMSKVATSTVNLTVFSVFCGSCNYVMIVLPAGGLEQPGAAFATTVGLFLTQLMFFAAGLLIASLVKKYKSAVQIGTVFLLASYVVAITAQYAGLPLLDYLSPLRYFDVYEVTLNGIRISCLITAYP